MTEDFSFIKLFKNDLASAKLADDTPVQTLPYGGFIVQQPNETFLQTSAGSTSISFVGGIQVDLIDSCGNVLQNIDNNFYYNGFTDSSGVQQISFEFGLLGVDYWSEQVYLKITDLINLNVWYSNGFLITNDRTDLSSRFDYTNKRKIFNISYDLAPYTQSVRFADCYDQSPANKEELKQYVTAGQGFQINYRGITTFLRKYVMSAVDYFVSDRLYALKSHTLIYCNGQRVTISDYKVNEREGDVNWTNAEFLINPQGEKLTTGYQLYEYLDVVTKTPSGNYSLANYNTATATSTLFQLTFNKPFQITNDIEAKLYKDGSLFATFDNTKFSISGNDLNIDVSDSPVTANGVYDIVIAPNKVFYNIEQWAGFALTQWRFTLLSGEYDGTDYDNTEYLTD